MDISAIVVVISFDTVISQGSGFAVID